MIGTGHGEESVAVSGSRWYTVAFLVVGILNYGYAVVLTRLLDVASYSIFAAGQAVLLIAGTLATVSVPWVLAQALARAHSGDQRSAATRFAMMASAGTGVIAAVAVATLVIQFASPVSTLAVALSVLIIFVGATTKGWLQGRERMGRLSALTVAEGVLKVVAGLLLVAVAGLRDTGALLAFGIGGLLLIVFQPFPPRGSGRPWLAALASRDLWRRAVGIAGIQGLVVLLAAIDVVLVTALPASRAAAASYQASATLSRVPLFVGSAVSAAFFPSLSRCAIGGPLAGRALRLYLVVALPFTAVLVTMPASVLGAVFPAQYGDMAILLKFTAVAGLSLGGMNVVSTFFQAVDDYSCLWWQGAGLAWYVAALLAGWTIGGITGLAVGAAVGTALALALLSYCLVRRQGHLGFAGIPLAEALVAAAVLFLLRPYEVWWLVAATLVGVLAAVRFLRTPRSRQDRNRAVPVQKGEL